MRTRPNKTNAGSGLDFPSVRHTLGKGMYIAIANTTNTFRNTGEHFGRIEILRLKDASNSSAVNVPGSHLGSTKPPIGD